MSNMMTIKIGGEAQPVFGLRMLHLTKTTGDLYALACEGAGVLVA